MTETVTRADVPPDTAPEATSSRPRWERPGLALLLIGTAVAYFWRLTANGWANEFYAAAVQSGARSWKAFFFGSLDPGNIVTVDKTPLSLWPMELSARLFGFSSWSMLMPEVLLGVASVAVLWATVRRPFGPGAGLLAGLVLALTPVAALMFRFNNPDAALTFLIVAAAWAMTRALASGRWRWLVLTGLFIGFGFLAKQLQVMLVVPGLALAYLVAGPRRLVVRIGQLCAAAAGLLVGAGWWVLIAQLWPVDSRPYIGGSEDNSVLDLTLGYNGLQRLSSDGGGPRSGTPGITRLFQPELAGQITWLVPAALALLLAGLVLRGRIVTGSVAVQRFSRTDPQRAALLLWGGWLLVSGLVFSFMTGIFHSYYTMTMAPAVAALIGGGSVLLWRERERVWVRIALALSVALTVATAWSVLSRTPDFFPWLRWTVLVAGVAAAVALLVPLRGRAAAVAALAAVLVGLAGPVAYTADSLASAAHGGGGTSAGPRVAGRGWGGPMGHGPVRPGQGWSPNQPGPGGAVGRNDAGDAGPGGNGASGPGAPGQGGPGNPGAPGGTGNPGAPVGAGGAGAPGRGGPGFGATPSERVIAMLRENAGSYTWAGAAVSSHSANSYQLESEVPVMSIGGFSGGDPAPTLARFQQYVAEHRIHYFLGGGRGGFGDDRDTESAKITAWVQQHYTATTVDGVAVYDLTAPAR
ncbi:glycosyltransferase family 39 protein [Nocardia sp. alder85J]|uniref:glycosyltransferase family 39 protein n=1 Tax=Nocardia sp. alder85J TaxID=2862949 RepID=UPI001CD69362|nr:glycosyltransferase family 39 protein [Nocardia sp. alder85J]MCX4095470.1 glycosyltransferase family 39 protein [Nocardia sp. alder85J]